MAILDSGARVVGGTATLEALLGHSHEQLAHAPLLDLVHPDDRPQCRLSMQRLLAGHAPNPCVIRFKHRDASFVWMEVRPALSSDKTAILLEGARAAQPRAHRTDANVPALILNEIEEGVLMADASADGVPIVEANSGFTQLSGYTVPEILGRPLNFLADGNTDQAKLEDAIATAKQGKRAAAELGFSRKDGAPLWIRLNLVPFTDASGQVDRIAAIFLDVSERRIVFDALREKNAALTEALESLQKTKEAIVQRERMHALGKMASGIVHDFNNLLAPILGFTELLLTFPPMLQDEEKVTTYLRKIRTAANDGATVVARLREFYRSRDEADAPALFSVQHAVEETLDLTRHRWRNEAQASGNRVELSVDLQKTPPVNGLVAEIRQALTNLVLNGIDAMPEGGLLTVKTYPVGNWACIQISDTGTGMSQETRRRCFEPFFTTKGKAGTGLGLSIVFGIIERHRGRVELDSNPGTGTTFTIWLPVSQIEDPDQVAIAGGADLIPLRPLKVLVVDDEDLFLEVVSENLLNMGHFVDCFVDPTIALEAFYKSRYDLVITDRAMPGMTGDQLAKRLREYQPSIPIVLLTGFGNIIKQNGEQPPNITEVMPKPVSQQSLREMLARYGSASQGAACA